jgi:RNA polymerase sigma factor (sigma-70 family)
MTHNRESGYEICNRLFAHPSKSRMQALTDSECIRMILRGDKSYYAHLVEKYQTKAYNLSYRMLKDGESARDATQDAFIRAYEALPGFRLDSAFSTWFYRILYNTCISRIRANRRFTAGEPREDSPGAAGNDNEAIRGLDREDMRRMLKDAYSVLSGEEIFLIEQFYKEECSIEEISGMTGLSHSNVKVRLFRTRKKMYDRIRSVLKEEIHQWQTK